MFIDIIRHLQTSETLWLQLLSSFCIVFTHFRNSPHNSMIAAVQQQSPQIRLHSFPQLSHIKRQISETRHDPPGFRIISRRYTQEIMQKSVFWYGHQVSLHRFWYCRCSFYFSKSDESASDSAYIKSDIWRLFEICYKNLKQRLNVSDKSGSCFIHHSSFIIHHSSFIIHHSSFIIHHSSRQLSQNSCWMACMAVWFVLFPALHKLSP